MRHPWAVLPSSGPVTWSPFRCEKRGACYTGELKSRVADVYQSRANQPRQGDLSLLSGERAPRLASAFDLLQESRCRESRRVRSRPPLAGISKSAPPTPLKPARTTSRRLDGDGDSRPIPQTVASSTVADARAREPEPQVAGCPNGAVASDTDPDSAGAATVRSPRRPSPEGRT